MGVLYRSRGEGHRSIVGFWPVESFQVARTLEVNKPGHNARTVGLLPAVHNCKYRTCEVQLQVSGQNVPVTRDTVGCIAGRKGASREHELSVASMPVNGSVRF